MRQLWFSIYDFSFDYKGTESPFADPAEFRWSEEFEKNSDAIFTELKQYLIKNELDPYFNSSMVSKKSSWRTIALKNWGIELTKNQRHFPLTDSLIKKYPEIVSASFNLLEPQSKILLHCGDTNAIYRCHLGLEIPAGLPETGFKVKGESRAWEKGKWLIFMDAYVHEAWNNSDKKRYIFLIDVIRDEYADKKNIVCATVRTSLFLQKRAERMLFFKRVPESFIKVVTKSLIPFAWLSIRIVNLLKIY